MMSRLVMLHTVQEIKEVAPFYVTLRFNTGEVMKVDLEKSLRQWTTSPTSLFRELLNEKYFTSVKLDTDMETICWDNGIDLCPDVLYSMGTRL